MTYPQSYEDMVFALHLTNHMKKCLADFEQELLNKHLDLSSEAHNLNEVQTCFKDLKELLGKTEEVSE